VRRVAVLAAAIAALTGGCGIGGGGNLQQIGSEDLAGLDQTTTSSTTTTTTTVPVDTAAGTTTSAASTSTIATEPVELYYVAGGVLESVTRDVFRGISLFGVLRALESPPPPDVAVGLTSVLPIGLTRGVTESGTGVATVDLVGDIFENIEGGDEQRQAVAQIVLTLTRRPGIGQVRFTLDGEDLQIPKRGNVLSEPGEAVSRLDYESLLDQSDVSPTDPPTTFTTTSAPETTESTESTESTDTVSTTTGD
jgi:spore germination protein GerM